MTNGCESDHDRIVKLESRTDIKLTSICKAVGRIEKKIDKFDDRINEKLDKKSYYLHLFILIGAFSGVVGFVASKVFC